MLPEQKWAWFVVVLFLVAIGGVAALVPFAGVHAWGAIGVFGLAGLTPLLFPARPKPGLVVRDERDQLIVAKATLGGFAMSHSWFVLGCMAVWFYCMLSGQRAFSIEVLPFIVILGTVIHFVSRAVATLFLYREHGANGENSDNKCGPPAAV
ncbi:MAG: hypothetical protein ACYTFZ_06045 [Planctomycetota bacterium]|jgi:hypothetical protein